MKMHGKPLSKMNNQVIIFPREDGDIVFRAAPVIDFSEFEKLCPEVTPPMMLKRGETVPIPDFENAKYKEATAKRNRNYTLYMILKSLQATEGLEWETVKLTDPSTWENLDKELEASGLTNMERGQILQAVMRANSLDMTYIEEARKRFFALAQQKAPTP
jgi:hypothetical protein